MASDLTQAKENLEKLLDDVRAEDQRMLEEREALAEVARLEKVRELGQAGLKDYKAKLSNHDWFFEYSDDFRVYDKGWQERKAIERLQQILDPEYNIWNEFAPEHFNRPKGGEN